MAIEYLGLSSINGPLVVLDGVENAAYDEIVEMNVGGQERKLGKIIELYGEKAIIQVFEGTENMALRNTHTRLTGHPMEIVVSEEMLGRTFNGIGKRPAGRERKTVESSFTGISQKLYTDRYLGYRRTDYSDPRTETADFLRQRTSPRSACCPDRTAGIPGR